MIRKQEGMEALLTVGGLLEERHRLGEGPGEDGHAGRGGSGCRGSTQVRMRSTTR